MNPVTSLWYGVDPMQEKSPFISTYVYTFNNPVHFIDPNGKWGEDVNGNLIAEKGDNAWTLAKYLNTSAEISTKMLNEQGYSINENGILNLKVGDIFKVERESPKPEERMDLGFVGNNIKKAQTLRAWAILMISFTKKILIRVSHEPDGQSRRAAARESGQ